MEATWAKSPQYGMNQEGIQQINESTTKRNQASTHVNDAMPKSDPEQDSARALISSRRMVQCLDQTAVAVLVAPAAGTTGSAGWSFVASAGAAAGASAGVSVFAAAASVGA